MDDSQNETLPAYSSTEEEELPVYSAPQTTADILDNILTHKRPESGISFPIESCPTIDDTSYTTAQFNTVIICDTFFRLGIESGNCELVEQLIRGHGIVTANTTNSSRHTPLLAAVAKGDGMMVRCLLQLGANINLYGVVEKETGKERTPLQFASQTGNLTLVKLLMQEPHCADDSLIAPDGETALHLAVANNHREIVDFLPTRRGGEFRRWTVHHEKAMQRIKKAIQKIRDFIKVLVWDIPKFFVYTIPKHVIVLPAKKSLDWCWKNHKRFGPWCKRKVKEIPARIKKAAKWTAKTVTKIPKAIWVTVKLLGKMLWKTAKYLFDLVTRRIPHAIKVSVLWIWNFLKTIGTYLGHIVGRVISFLHTLVTAVITYFRSITLKDVWNGFVDVLRAIFLTFPQMVWKVLVLTIKQSCKVLETIFGTLGLCIWLIFAAIFWLVMYIPVKMWDILKDIGGSLMKAIREVRSWVNPKM